MTVSTGVFSFISRVHAMYLGHQTHKYYTSIIIIMIIINIIINIIIVIIIIFF